MGSTTLYVAITSGMAKTRDRKPSASTSACLVGNGRILIRHTTWMRCPWEVVKPESRSTSAPQVGMLGATSTSECMDELNGAGRETKLKSWSHAVQVRLWLWDAIFCSTHTHSWKHTHACVVRRSQTHAHTDTRARWLEHAPPTLTRAHLRLMGRQWRSFTQPITEFFTSSKTRTVKHGSMDQARNRWGNIVLWMLVISMFLCFSSMSCYSSSVQYVGSYNYYFLLHFKADPHLFPQKYRSCAEWTNVVFWIPILLWNKLRFLLAVCMK